MSDGGDQTWRVVRIEPLGLSLQVPLDSPLLSGARAAGVELPSSCRNGTCRTCLCRMAQGQVVYRIEWPGLSQEEKDEGFILPCVAYPVTDLVIEVRGAKRISAPLPT